MLCCGVLTLLAALVIGFRRWLRAVPRSLLVAGGGVLLAVPMLALATTESSAPMSRADVPDRAIHSWCGRPLQ